MRFLRQLKQTVSSHKNIMIIAGSGLASNSTYKPASWVPGVTLYTIYLQPVGSTSVYVFDCYFSTEIVSELRKTQHPVQTGGNISDHAFLIPMTLNFDIGMSDVGVSFNNSWDGSAAKSIQAYQTLQGWQKTRTFLNFTCKFGTFSNFLVERISARLTAKTIYGLRANVTLSQVFLVTVSANTVSARPAATSSTSQGKISTIPVKTTVTANNKVTGSTPSATAKDSFDSTNKTLQNDLQNQPGVTTWGSQLYKSIFGGS